jgi:hypothetical protein
VTQDPVHQQAPTPDAPVLPPPEVARHTLADSPRAAPPPAGEPLDSPADGSDDQDRVDALDGFDALDGLDAALGRAVARYYAGDHTSDPALQEAVHAATDALRADGVDVITALRTVKAQIAACDVPPGRLVDDVVRWCIARYYDRAVSAPPRPETPVRRAPHPGALKTRGRQAGAIDGRDPRA